MGKTKTYFNISVDFYEEIFYILPALFYDYNPAEEDEGIKFDVPIPPGIIIHEISISWGRLVFSLNWINVPI